MKLHNKIKAALMVLALAGIGTLVSAQTKDVAPGGDGNVSVIQIAQNGGTPTFQITNNNDFVVIVRFVQPNIVGTTFTLSAKESRNLGAYAAYKYFVCHNGGSPVVDGTVSTAPEYNNTFTEVSCKL
jgi:hypothetical protein